MLPTDERADEGACTGTKAEVEQSILSENLQYDSNIIETDTQLLGPMWMNDSEA